MTEREIFFHVIDLTEPAERFEFIEKACADTAVRNRIEALLRSHTAAGRFLEVPAVAPKPSSFESFTPTPNPSADPTRDIGDDDAPDDTPSFLDPSSRPGSLGRLGHYEIQEVVGRGGFGIVYRAIDDLLERAVAIKVFAATVGNGTPAHRRFLREARASAMVRHENVVQVYDVVEKPVPYLVMEFIRGETLQQRLDRNGALDISEALRIGQEIAEGLAAAHAQGLIHRDIKPSNILLEGGPEGRVKITDFGLARSEGDVGLTQSGVLAGTPLYMAPEIALGAEFDSRADLFSLGSVLYAMVAGRPPFQATNTYTVLKSVVESDARPVRECNPAVPAWLGDLIARLHSKDPNGRFATAREVADQLGRSPSEWEATRELTDIPVPTLRFPVRRWAAIAAFVAVAIGVVTAEAFGVTNVRGTILRILSPEGTLVVEVDDPGVSVTVDGSEVVIVGAGVKEVRLKTGPHSVVAKKDGQIVKQELFTIEKDGRKIVTVERIVNKSDKPDKSDGAATAEWERSVSLMTAVDQVKAVAARLKQLNPGYDGNVTSNVEEGVVRNLVIRSENITDLTPLRVLTGLTSLNCSGLGSYKMQSVQVANGQVQVSSVDRCPLRDLSPLKGLPLVRLSCFNSNVSDLSPLAGMKLTSLELSCSDVRDLSPVKGMPLTDLRIAYTKVANLDALAGMKLVVLDAEGSAVSDLSPIRGMPVQKLSIGTGVSDLSPLKGMPIVEFTAYRCERLADVSPLKGMPLRIVNLQKTKVSSVSGLAESPIHQLNLNDTPIADLSPLREIKTLQTLFMKRTKVTDLAPIKGLAIKRIEVNGLRPELENPILRGIPTLDTINLKPVAEYFKQFDKK